MFIFSFLPTNNLWETFILLLRLNNQQNYIKHNFQFFEVQKRKKGVKKKKRKKEKHLVPCLALSY